MASHIDREAFGLLGHFGFLPDDLDIDALEITSRAKLNEVKKELTPRNTKPLLFNSDAHRLKDIGYEHNRIMAETKEFSSIIKALTGAMN